MAKGKINLQAADGAVIGLVVPDGLTSGERQISLGANLSGITAYHLLQGNLAVSNSTITQGFNTTLHTGNGATQAVNTGIDMDTQWGNTAEEKFGGLVWMKSRSVAGNNYLFDTIRGATHRIVTDSTYADAIGITMLTAFNNNGFSVGSDIAGNTNATTYAGWNFQTTHRVSGTTNHGKAYTCHYNPFTGFTIVKYEGSGIAGHEIPHHLGRKCSLSFMKSLTTVQSWVVDNDLGNSFCYLNTTNAFTPLTSESGRVNRETYFMIDGNYVDRNASGVQYIYYGWANSYFDESNKLIGNYEIVTYQGTGAVGNKVKTRGKPAWVMVKRTDANNGNWLIYDNQRRAYLDARITANSSAAEYVNYDVPPSYNCILNNDNFTVNQGAEINQAGGQYIALVAYDTNSNGGGSYYPLANDTATVQINNALIPLAQGIDSNGAKNTILSKNETITGLTYTQGKNYVYCDKNGSYGVTPYKPRYLESELVRTYAGEAPEYYDSVKNKWFNTSGQGELVTNGTFSSGTTTGWTPTGASSSLTTVNGMCKISGTADHGILGTISGLTIGKKYKICFYFDISLISNKNLFFDGTTGMTLIPELSNTYVSVNGSFTLPNIGYYSYEFTASVTNGTFNVRNTGNQPQDWYIDNISVFASDIVPTTEITNSRNYLNHIVHADNDGGVLYVEELPKIEYKDIVKANEFKGKNACTAWVNFDGTTTPPTIRDSYNVSAVIRTAAGLYDIYFEEPMDNTNYAPNVSANKLYSWADGGQANYNKTVSKLSILNVENGTGYNTTDISIHIDGGRN